MPLDKTRELRFMLILSSMQINLFCTFVEEVSLRSPQLMGEQQSVQLMTTILSICDHIEKTHICNYNGRTICLKGIKIIVHLTWFSPLNILILSLQASILQNVHQYLSRVQDTANILLLAYLAEMKLDMAK